MLEHAPSTRILLVDTDQAARALIRTALAALAREIVCVNDAESALCKIRQEGDFAVVLTTQLLPGMSGLELIAAIQQQIKPAPPIIMVTGRAPGYDMAAKAQAAGAHATVYKPFSASELRAPVLTLLRSASIGDNGQKVTA